MTAARGAYRFYSFEARAEMIDALADYVERGMPLGDFLRSVVSNDLMGAVGRADEDNQRNIPALCAYLYNEMPSACYGSPERYEAWIEEWSRKRTEGVDK